MSDTPRVDPAQKRPARAPRVPLKSCFDPANKWEIGVDEAGRGPLFGRLYVAGTIVPRQPRLTGGADEAINATCPGLGNGMNAGVRPEFRHDWMKDSKRFSSEKKIREVADHIRANSVAYTVRYLDHDVIDAINIRQAVLRLMRECCGAMLARIRELDPECDVARDVLLVIDGNDFPIMTMFERDELIQVRHETVEKGDNTYCSVAAASILAKVARDDYIAAVCAAHPGLDERYGLLSNKGYGTKRHLDGIRAHGISEWHRKSYRIKSIGGGDGGIDSHSDSGTLNGVQF